MHHQINSYNPFTSYYFKWALHTHGIPNEGVSRVYVPVYICGGGRDRVTKNENVEVFNACIRRRALFYVFIHLMLEQQTTSWRYNVNEDDPEWLLVAEASITSYCLTWLICILDRKLTDFHYTN